MKFKLLLIVLLAGIIACTGDQKAGKEATKSTVVKENPNLPKVISKKDLPEVELKPVEKIDWVLIDFEYEGKKRTVFDNSKITLTFNDGYLIRGSGGCNSYMANYEMSYDGSLKLEKLASSRKMCQELMGQEQQYLELLEGANTYEMKDNTLRINCVKGILNFVSAI